MENQLNSSKSEVIFKNPLLDLKNTGSLSNSSLTSFQYVLNFTIPALKCKKKLRMREDTTIAEVIDVLLKKVCLPLGATEDAFTDHLLVNTSTNCWFMNKTRTLSSYLFQDEDNIEFKKKVN